jgi:hypothetical protein
MQFHAAAVDAVLVRRREAGDRDEDVDGAVADGYEF